MRVCRKVTAFAVIIAVSLGLAGCGGGPSNGDQANSGQPTPEETKNFLEGYQKSMTKSKGQKAKH